MFNTHLKIAFRNLTKRKGYTLLNIAGLTLGMTCCLLIFHYVSFERSYDDFEPRSQDLVRLRLDSYQKGKLAWKSATVYPAIAPTLKKDYPEIETFCRLHDAEMLLTNESKNVKFAEKKGYYADPATIDMFGIKLIQGDKKTALTGPDKIILTQTMAKKYFGNEPALGKTLSTSNGELNSPYEVTGVMEDFPANSHLDIRYLVSYATLGKLVRAWGDTSNSTETSFGWYDFYSYLLLKPGADYRQLQAKLPAFTDRHINSIKWYKENNTHTEIQVIPVSDIHLYSNYNQEAEANGNGQAVSFLFLVAIFIIGIAWINYINLATARSVERAREVGVRKVLGAIRKELVRQFLVESFLLNIISLVLSFLFFFALLNGFDYFTGRSSATGFALSRDYWMVFGTVFLAGTVLSGLYPAFVLSGFKPIEVLKGNFKNSSGGIYLRKGLIIAQFVTSVVLIAGTIIVFEQVQFMRRQNLGANINQTMVLQAATSMNDSLHKNIFQPFKQELQQLPFIKSVTSSTSVMGDEIYWTSGVTRLNSVNETAVTLYHLGVDYDFVPAYGLKLLAGRNFSPAFPSDEKAVLLNEKAVELLGFKSPEDAINKQLSRNRDSLTIVGVLENYHHQGLQKAIDPMVVLFYPSARQFYSLKLENADPQKAISSISSIWNKHFPRDPLDFFFLDESFDRQYKSDMLFGKVFAVFSFIAILIACFGLLGLSAYNVLQRTREIGIRKVLGASVQSILLLLSKDFVRLILIALLLAVPIGWYIMHQWLQDFAYRIKISAWVFVLAGFIAFMIAVVMICLQSLRSAVDNPVKSLREF